MEKFLISNILLLLLFSQILSNDFVFAKIAPALYVFGDSLFDSGNNNWLPTLAKANFKPYGAKFSQGPTGRFTNGKTVADFIAENMKLPYAPPYVKFRLGPIPVTGLNYASGSCGVLPKTGSSLGKCLNLEEQVNKFEDTVKILLPKQMQNTEELAQHLSNSIYIISVGSNDYINNYLNPKHFDSSKNYNPQAFANLLIENLSQKFERLYKLGARKVLAFELGPIGCIPTFTRDHKHDKHDQKCVEEINNMVKLYNDQLKIKLANLTSSLPGSTFALGSVYSFIYDTIMNPSKYGFGDTSTGCCKSWGNGTSACVPLQEPCKDMDKHFFWDGFHLTETAYSLVADRCLNDRSVCPTSIQQLIEMYIS